jgi:hypothetical protein
MADRATSGAMTSLAGRPKVRSRRFQTVCASVLSVGAVLFLTLLIGLWSTPTPRCAPQTVPPGCQNPSPSPFVVALFSMALALVIAGVVGLIVLELRTHRWVRTA